MRRRLKVLVCAYACSPFRGSEPGVGWGYVHALSHLHDLHVLVEEEEFRAEVEQWVHSNAADAHRPRFYFIRRPRNRLLRKIWPPSYYWYYRRWHRRAFRLARALHTREKFDLVHQLTMVGFREPGYLWRLGVPAVWGPVGGMGAFPWRFLTQVGLRGGLYYLGYNLYNYWQVRALRRPRLAAQAAGPGLVVATQENRLGARRFWRADAEIIPEVGVSEAVAGRSAVRAPGEPLRLAWIGVLAPGKALNLALSALATLPRIVTWELDVVGDGPMHSKWRALAARLSLSERVRFHGWKPREQAIDLMRRAHVLLISSLRDLTSTVTVEALAVGLPVICPGHCGFIDAVRGGCGILVSIASPSVFREQLAGAVRKLHDDEPLRRRMAAAARARAADFEWKVQAVRMDRVYQRVIEHK